MVFRAEPAEPLPPIGAAILVFQSSRSARRPRRLSLIVRGAEATVGHKCMLPRGSKGPY
jgi:hypothetical protein